VGIERANDHSRVGIDGQRDLGAEPPLAGVLSTLYRIDLRLVEGVDLGFTRGAKSQSVFPEHIILHN